MQGLLPEVAWSWSLFCPVPVHSVETELCCLGGGSRAHCYPLPCSLGKGSVMLAKSSHIHTCVHAHTQTYTNTHKHTRAHTHMCAHPPTHWMLLHEFSTHGAWGALSIVKGSTWETRSFDSHWHFNSKIGPQNQGFTSSQWPSLKFFSGQWEKDQGRPVFLFALG